jgi:zinc D-Ala-D-Ala carboxypeptidase
MKYFKLEEFDDAPGTGKNMNKYFLSKLEKAREIANIPFIINSGWRSKETNKRVGGTPNSSHLKGVAADIKCIDSSSREVIIRSCILAGFSRIGVAKTFIHVDSDESKNSAIWLY